VLILYVQIDTILIPFGSWYFYQFLFFSLEIVHYFFIRTMKSIYFIFLSWLSQKTSISFGSIEAHILLWNDFCHCIDKFLRLRGFTTTYSLIKKFGLGVHWSFYTPKDTFGYIFLNFGSPPPLLDVITNFWGLWFYHHLLIDKKIWLGCALKLLYTQLLFRVL